MMFAGIERGSLGIDALNPRRSGGNIEGRPALRIIARLAGILEDELDNPTSRDKFWCDARRKLGKLRRLNQGDIGQIETMLAKRIPKPAATYTPTVRRAANPVTGSATVVATGVSGALIVKPVTRSRKAEV